jgi:hypothetical protein
MKKIGPFLLLLSFIFHLSGCANFPSQTKSHDWIIIHGQKIGSITASTTFEELITIYGKENVKKTMIWDGIIDSEERSEVNGIILYPETSNEITLYYNEPFKITGGFLQQKSEWKITPGIAIGMSLKEVEKLNGGPFKLYGFEWDFSGTVTDWQNGKLEFMGTRIQFSPDKINPGNPEELTVLGDSTFDSSNTVMQRLNPKVTRLAFEL